MYYRKRHEQMIVQSHSPHMHNIYHVFQFSVSLSPSLSLCIYIYTYIYICQRGENRACSRADFFDCCMFLWGFGWGGGGVGGWGGMLTFIGLAHWRDATLLHVLFNLHNYVMLRYCTFSSIYTTTWCYVDWGGGVVGVITSMLTPSWSLRL